MKLIRCNMDDLAYALEAMNIVKHEKNTSYPQSTKADLLPFLASAQNHLYVAIEDQRAVAYLVAYELQRVDRDAKMMFFYEISVLTAYRQRGIGLALIERLKTYCNQNGFMKMYLSTNRSNIPAMRLYAKAGGQESKELDELFFTWHFSNYNKMIN